MDMISWFLLVSILGFLGFWWRKLPAESAPEKAVKLGLITALWGGLGIEVASVFSQLTSLFLSFWWLLGTIPTYFLSTRRLSWQQIAWPMIGVMSIYAIQSIYFPPNNYDSMSYHLPRVLTWIQQQQVDFFTTGIARQLYYNPLAEYLITHLYLALGGDYAANLVQWLALAGSQLIIGLILAREGASFRTQAMGMGLTLLHPMIGFESTTTQNDLVAGFFLLASIYFTLQDDSRWLVLALVLGGWVKYTVWMLYLPWGIYWIWKKRGKIGWTPVQGILLAVATIGPFWYRNFQTYRHPLGPTDGHPDYIDVTNNLYTLPALASNALRTLGNNLGLPWQTWNKAMLRGFDELHKQVLGISLQSPDTTYAEFFFQPTFGFTEDNAGSLIWLMVVGFFFIRALLKQQHIFWWMGFITSFFLFCFLLKYQPMHNRLLSGWLMGLSIPLALGLRDLKNLHWIWIGLVLLQLPIWIFNKSKPLLVPENWVRKWRNQPHAVLSDRDFHRKPDYLGKFYYSAPTDSTTYLLRPDRETSQDPTLVRVLIDELRIPARPSALEMDRHRNYFQNRYAVYPEAQRAVTWIKNQGCLRVELWMGFDAMEYPLRRMLLDQAPQTQFYGHQPGVRTGDCLLSMDRALPERLDYQKKFSGQFIQVITY